jgi:hypothetical protein
VGKGAKLPARKAPNGGVMLLVAAPARNARSASAADEGVPVKARQPHRINANFVFMSEVIGRLWNFVNRIPPNQFIAAD